MQTWIKRIRRTTKARDETDLPWMKKMKGERKEEEGREGKKRGMLIRKAEITYLLYIPRRLFLPRGPHQDFQTMSAITPRSRRTPWAAGRPGEVEDWGE